MSKHYPPIRMCSIVKVHRSGAAEAKLLWFCEAKGPSCYKHIYFLIQSSRLCIGSTDRLNRLTSMKIPQVLSLSNYTFSVTYVLSPPVRSVLAAYYRQYRAHLVGDIYAINIYILY